LPFALSGSRARGGISRSLEGLGAWHDEPESIGQPTDNVERETDRERILDLLSRSAGSEDCLLVFDIHRMLARQLAYHSKRRMQRLHDVEIGQRRRDRFRIAIGPLGDRRVDLRTELAQVRPGDALTSAFRACRVDMSNLTVFA